MVRYANGLEFVSVKAYDFYDVKQLSVHNQTEHADGDAPSQGTIQTRTLATIMARVDLVLIEPCGVHTSTLPGYQGHVDRLLAMLQDAVRWIKELQPRDYGLGDIAIRLCWWRIFLSTSMEKLTAGTGENTTSLVCSTQ